MKKRDFNIEFLNDLNVYIHRNNGWDYGYPTFPPLRLKNFDKNIKFIIGDVKCCLSRNYVLLGLLVESDGFISQRSLIVAVSSADESWNYSYFDNTTVYINFERDYS